MKILLLLTALCLTAMAQEQKLPENTSLTLPERAGQAVEMHPELQAMRAARIAAYIETARAFAERAFANPELIESTARAARAKVLAGKAEEVLFDREARMAEQLYQIQEEFGLQAAVRVAQIMASLPTLSKAGVIK